MISKKIILFFLLSFCALPSYAAQVSYTYSGTWSDNFSGIFGSTYTSTIIFDNGGTSTINQTFTQSDFISATLISGTYNFTMNGSDIVTWNSDFTSDALGQLLGQGWFDALNGANDWHYDNDFQDETFVTTSNGTAGFFQTHISNPGILVPINTAPANIPTLSEWSIILLTLLLGSIGIITSKRNTLKRH